MIRDVDSLPIQIWKVMIGITGFERGSLWKRHDCVRGLLSNSFLIIPKNNNQNK
jgi:hypothetical protein